MRITTPFSCSILILYHFSNYVLVCVDAKGVIVMCSVGGGDFNLEVEELEMEQYKCKDCGNKFNGMGEDVVCPGCQSSNVEKL
jgi:Zn finger protein HypA/HybF involved in hydrogenase expression